MPQTLYMLFKLMILYSNVLPVTMSTNTKPETLIFCKPCPSMCFSVNQLIQVGLVFVPKLGSVSSHATGFI